VLLFDEDRVGRGRVMLAGLRAGLRAGAGAGGPVLSRRRLDWPDPRLSAASTVRPSFPRRPQ